MSINNREDANKYYQLINELVDEYMSKGKIRPSNLKRYLEPGSDRFKKFLIRNELNEISGIDRILSDVIEDRANMESDGVLTFESFRFFESDEFKVKSLRQCLYKGIEKADLKMEKVLADVFDTNLGSIDIIDSDKHVFSVENSNVVVYSKEDLEIIKNNIIDFLYDELKTKTVLIGGLVELSLSDITGDVGYIRFSIAEKLNLNDIISNLLNAEHHKSFNDYEIWID